MRRRTRPRERARRLLDRFGLAGREDERPDDLSGGQQQRVALARAFAGRPRALLLDEVTSALDPELVGEVLEAVRDLKQEGVTMLIATHEMSFAREVADLVAFLHEGRILELGPARPGPRRPRAPGDEALPAPAARGRAHLGDAYRPWLGHSGARPSLKARAPIACESRRMNIESAISASVRSCSS